MFDSSFHVYDAAQPMQTQAVPFILQPLLKNSAICKSHEMCARVSQCGPTSYTEPCNVVLSGCRLLPMLDDDSPGRS